MLKKPELISSTTNPHTLKKATKISTPSTSGSRSNLRSWPRSLSIKMMKLRGAKLSAQKSSKNITLYHRGRAGPSTFLSSLPQKLKTKLILIRGSPRREEPATSGQRSTNYSVKVRKSSRKRICQLLPAWKMSQMTFQLIQHRIVIRSRLKRWIKTIRTWWCISKRQARIGPLKYQSSTLR